MGAHGSAQPWLWASTVVAAHLFAAFWLLRALSFMAPGAWPAAKQRIRRLWGGGCVTAELPVDDAAKADAHARRLAVSIHSQETELGPLVSVGHNQPHLGATHSNLPLPGSSQHNHPTHDSDDDIDSVSDEGSISEHVVDGVVLTVAPACASGKHSTEITADKDSRQLPSPPSLQLEWCALGCSYRAPEGHKTVLEDVWGAAQAGQLQVGGCQGSFP
jgi:hypothetical protein